MILPDEELAEPGHQNSKSIGDEIFQSQGSSWQRSVPQGVGDKVPHEPAPPRGLGVARTVDGKAVRREGLGRRAVGFGTCEAVGAGTASAGTGAWDP